MFRRKKDNSQTKQFKERSKQLDHLLSSLKIKVKNKKLLHRALTHRSYVNECDFEVKDNERLEYLGDSVLGLIVNEYLFTHFEHYPEGNLAKIKSAVVSEETLAAVARKLNLGDYMFMGKGEDNSGGRSRSSILANALEALIGALYIDAGFKVARNFVLRQLKGHIERVDRLTYTRDPKTTLQEYVQKKFKERPKYLVEEEKGPDHRKEFVIQLFINNKFVAKGRGSSKRKAEMDAAIDVLKRMDEGELVL